MRVIFMRSHLPLSFLIRALTWSRWSHVAVVLDNGMVVDCRGDGVRLKTLEQATKNASAWELRDLPAGNASKAMHELGKPYDFGGLLPFLFRPLWRRDWSHNKRWFCSELVAHASGLFCTDRISRVTPEHVYMISHPIEDNP